MKKVFSILLLLFMVSLNCYCGGVPILIKGKVLDEFSNTPTEVTMVIKGKDDKKIKIQPNILTGEYQQVLNSGDVYEVTFLNYDVVKETKTINIEYSEDYKEVEIDFNIKKMTNNRTIYQVNCFNTGTTQISNECSKLFKDFIDVYRFNRGAKFKLVLNSSKAKNKKAEAELLASLQNACAIWNDFSTRYTIETEKLDSQSDLQIIVTEIKDPLKQ